ncbi:DUF2339 domain-containing protein [Streptomyces sp. SID9727]|uniref:DUF2339 domain-containing protein n=1 Tax=Streptomyces sp. SID9727 TaxID=2706114 RepID=UPI0013CDACE6|nr:DUF2339 domain-containing protein [Streptomyces sp. SID9727]NEC67918.1 DUF2339 domain-containing protein [Streptomyces sp. SID9727]
MIPRGPDCTVTTLIELQGGRAQWDKAMRRIRELGWTCHELSPKERRTVRRAFDPDDGYSEFWWVEVPIVGSTWRADREAAWRIMELSRSVQTVIYGRLFRRAEIDRVLEPEWQVHSTDREPAGTVTPGPRRLWRTVTRWCATRTGLFDVRVRIHASKDTARHLARHLRADGPRADLDVRPLDGRGRTGTPLHGEDALNRALALFGGPLLAMSLFLSTARHLPPFSAAVCWFLAVACAVPAWWTAFALPLARSRLHCLATCLIATLAVAVYTLGVPELFDGVDSRSAWVTAAIGFYVTGLILLGRRWRWQILAATVLPLLATLLVAALPLTGRILQDGYADELSLSPEETAVSGAYQILAAVKLLWPALAAILFIAAVWGVLRYFHFIRPRSVFAGTLAALFLTLGLLTVAEWTFASPRHAADELKRAAAHHTKAPPYFGISTDWVCVRPTVPVHALNEQGGVLAPHIPYLSFGVAEGNVVLWNAAADRPLRVPAGQVKLLPARNLGPACAT